MAIAETNLFLVCCGRIWFQSFGKLLNRKHYLAVPLWNEGCCQAIVWAEDCPTPRKIQN
jgi:hypothetical protein